MRKALRILLLAMLCAAAVPNWASSEAVAPWTDSPRWVGAFAPPGDPTSYRAQPVRPPIRISGSISEALWQDDVDTPEYFFWDAELFPTAVAPAGRRVFYVSHGRLIARDARTGTIVWQAGSDLAPAVLESRGTVYAANEDGIVYALSGASGRRRWSTPTDFWRVDWFVVLAGRLLVNSYGRGLLLLDAETGAPVWRAEGFGFDESASYYGLQAAAEGIVVVRSYAGEPHSTVFIAIRIPEGGVIWDQGWSGLPLVITGDRILFRDVWDDPDLDNQFTIKEYDLLTGKERRSYSYDLHPAGRNIKPRYEDAILYDGQAFLDMGCAVYRLRLGRPQTTVYNIRGTACRREVRHERSGVAPLPVFPPLPLYTTFFRGERGWLGGPHQGRLFLWDGRHMYSLDLDTRRTFTYSAIRSKVMRLLLIGNRAYIGEINGVFTVLDINSGRVLFRTHTGGRNFDIRVGAGVVLVQAERRLIAFALP